MNSRIPLSALVLVLLALGLVPSVSALTYEEYSSDYLGASALSKCNARTGANPAYVGAVSGQCVRDQNGDYQNSDDASPTLRAFRITCAQGGAVTTERFSNSNGTCSDENAYVTTLRNKACVDQNGQPATDTSNSVYYVDCDATTLPANITSNELALGSQYFSDSACTQPENDVAGYLTVGISYEAVMPNVCKYVGDNNGGGPPFQGTFRQSNSAGLVAIKAYDAACTDWAALEFTPLDGCQPTTLGSVYAGTLKASYVRYTSAAVAVTSPVAWPVAVGNHVQQQQCSDTACSANCNLVGLDRTGVCRPDLTSQYGSRKALLSADGKYLLTTYYNDTACAQRVEVGVSEHGKEGPCDAGVLTFAAAPSMTSPALVQLPLPPLVSGFYHSNNGGPTSCTAQDFLEYTFVEPGFCDTTGSSSSERFILTASSVNITSYKSSSSCVAGGNDAHSGFVLGQCTPLNQYGSIAEQYISRASVSGSTAIATLGGWYSTNLADQDAAQAFVKAGGTNNGGSSSGQNPSSGTTTGTNTGTTTGTNAGGSTTTSTGSAASADVPMQVTLRFNVALQVAQTAEWQKNTTAMLANVMHVTTARNRLIVGQVATGSFGARRLLADSTTVGVTVLPAPAGDASASVSVSAALANLYLAMAANSAQLAGVDTTYTAGLTPTVVGACADGSYTEECGKQNNNAAAPRAQGVLGAAVLLAALAMAL